MMEADYELAQRLQVKEQGELTIEEKSKLFVELMDKRKKHFAKVKAEEIRRKPPTKAQKRNQMCTYLKNIANYKHSQLKNKNFKEIQMLFDNTMKWADSFVPMDTEVVEGSKSQKRPHDSNASSSSTALNHPSSFHPLDDIVDENDEESFCSNSSSLSQNVSSSSNVFSRVLQNPPHESQDLNTYLSETINLQTQHRDDHRKGLRSIGKDLKDMMNGKQK
ncbi:hypothetical protein Tco_0579204 [Tanacetum coccineum]